MEASTVAQSVLSTTLVRWRDVTTLQQHAAHLHRISMGQQIAKSSRLSTTPQDRIDDMASCDYHTVAAHLP
jgi:hypothetical protein